MDDTKGYITQVMRASFALPAVELADTNGTLVTTAAISGLTAGVLTVAVARPDYPRTLQAYLTDANATITGATVTLVGLNQNGEGITEVLTFTAAGNKNTSNAFAVLLSATWALVSGTVTTTSDTIAIGFGPALGLPGAKGCVYGDLLHSDFNGAIDAGTFNRTYGTYNPAGTMDAAKPVEVQYTVKIPIVQ